MRACPIVEAIPKDKDPPSKETLMADLLIPPLKKKSRELVEKEENNQNIPNVAQSQIRKSKRVDSRRNTIISPAKKEFIMKNLGFSFLMSSSFKKNILEKLNHLQITVKFEVLNKRNLIETLTKVFFNEKIHKN